MSPLAIPVSCGSSLNRFRKFTCAHTYSPTAMMRWTTIRARARSTGDLTEKLPQGYRTVRNEGVVLDVGWTDELGRGFLRLLLVDHLFVERKDVVLITNGAAIIGVDKHNYFVLLSRFDFESALSPAHHYSKPTI